jgi:CheY-like chemotaxis protein
MNRILLVELYESIGMYIKSELENEGYSVVFVADGLRAIELLKIVEVDLITLDMKMPEPDGVRLMLHAKRDLHIPVVIFTENTGLRPDFQRYGADACVFKNCDTTELKSTIAALLVQKHASV